MLSHLLPIGSSGVLPYLLLLISRVGFSPYGVTCHSVDSHHPQDRIVLTCICWNGITNEIDFRHCIHTIVAGSLHCGMCVANDCSCECGLCGYTDVDSGYHLSNQTQLLSSSGSDDTTSEGAGATLCSLSLNPPNPFHHSKRLVST